MRDDSVATELTLDVTMTVTSPDAFVSEVRDFRTKVVDPGVPVRDKARAWDAIVRHAASLDPHEAGFERAGVALKEALCLWLDVRPSVNPG